MRGWMLAVLAGLFLAKSLGAGPRVDIHAEGEWLRVQSSEHANALVTLQGTTDFSRWENAATSLEKFFGMPIAAGAERKFYRLHVGTVGATNDWKNEVRFPDDSFFGGSGSDAGWVKFAILLSDPTRVHFQDSVKWPFHYDWATRRLPPFIGMTTTQFDAVSLNRAGQQVVLGSVLVPRNPAFVECGIQFVGRDAYTVEEIERWFELVKASVHAEGGAGVIYMPTFEQAEVARTQAAEFAARGIPVGSIERWVQSDHVYAAGWAVGRLKYFAAAEVTAAFADGRLAPADILVTDGVPAETPLVAGIISLRPSTPNSHTALLSAAFGIPFVYLPDAEEQARVVSLVGRKVILRASSNWFGSDVRVLDVEGAVTPEIEAEMLALKIAPPIEYTPKERFGAISASTENLSPADIKYFGGKAANYGLLRDAVPNNAPVAIAFSFDLWDAFMDQTLPAGGTLRAAIAARLAAHTTYPPNIPQLKADLAAVREMIRRTATFSAAERAEILAALGNFTPGRNIRFRSSTNVEDSDSFTGAGLYDSYSGCLMDDLDADNAGPSHCDATENEERGVFRAIQRVYSSFYNDNAFLERLRHRVNESEVGMGVLAHHSFPDDEELANGVANLTFRYTGFSTNVSGELVTQLGAESVTNPDGSSVPEVVEVSQHNTSAFLNLTRRSSLVPLGAYVMSWESDYQEMMRLLTAVGLRVKNYYPGRNEFFLNFEYKKDLRIGRVVKQVRQIPQPQPAQPVLAFLVDEPTTWCVFQGEFSDVFANHRLKSIWNLRTVTARMRPETLAAGIHTTGAVDYMVSAQARNLSGEMNGWPSATHSADGTTHEWTTQEGADLWRWRMVTHLQTMATPPQAPILTQRDFEKFVTVKYPRAMPTLAKFGGEPATTMEETVKLAPCPEIGAGAILREYVMEPRTGLRVETKFYWPRPPTGVVAGYTAPLVRFVETKIIGLTSQPIVLTSAFAQTYHPFHHNFTEEFVFEPRLDPGVPRALVEELSAANIQLIYLRKGDSTTGMILGLDEKFRAL